MKSATRRYTAGADMDNRARFLLAGLALGLVLVGLEWASGPARRTGQEGPPRHPACRIAAIGQDLTVALARASWINGPRPAADSLQGRPTVMVVWRSTDPGSNRALRLAEAWHRAYSRFGADVIAVHEPEFAFAADSSVPARAARRLDLTLPIAFDTALRFRWSGEHSAGRLGAVTRDSVGILLVMPLQASDFGAIERAIRFQVARLHPERTFPSDAGLVAAAPSPEFRIETVRLDAGSVRQGPLAASRFGRSQIFTAQFRHQEEGTPLTPYPVGAWTPQADGVGAARGGAANFIAIRYDAARASVVMSPPQSGATRVWILRDDAWLGRDTMGDDVALDSRGASYVEVTEPRLYSVARGGGSHTLKLSPESPGVMLHAFTFESTVPPGPE